jgi:hypothetical protein
MINEIWVGKDGKETGVGPFQCPIPAFTQENGENHKNIIHDIQYSARDSIEAPTKLKTAALSSESTCWMPAVFLETLR